MPESNPFSLQDKVVVQFGGTGLLGPGLVTALTAAGARLVVASRSRASLVPLLAREQAADRAFDPEEVQMVSESSLHALRDRVLARHGRIDGVVYNSASRPMRAMSDDLAKWQESMDTNATALFAALRTFGDVMAARRSGSIVTIASMQGVIGVNPSLYEGTTMGAAPDYFFHKGGVLSLTRYLAGHYGSQGARVNAVSPGGIYNPECPPFCEQTGVRAVAL